MKKTITLNFGSATETTFSKHCQKQGKAQGYNLYWREMPMRFGVLGCLKLLEESIFDGRPRTPQQRQEVLDEYVKFALAKRAGVKILPTITKVVYKDISQVPKKVLAEHKAKTEVANDGKVC
jgi:hypothetical protein